ncbi:hypothetical protein PIB30_075670 [Stylosanthes scabra]|uniref:DUF4283 domain-containing protein n=1 Tax=Stylosanthes scabra TaxID=79078 RepID=A0ABU6VQ41_9FABA|nr:hypothetical protein [Stylosanthes scabra]
MLGKHLALRRQLEKAMNNQLLLLVFDEIIRPRGDIFWRLSRRVWFEIVGLPVHGWCNETFKRISKLCGKMVNQDDRIEESKSFSIARFLVDSYQ